MDDLEPFESPKILIEGAKADIQDFDARCKVFVEACPRNVISSLDPNSRERIVKIRFEQRIPGLLRRDASGIVNDLRHALDQALCDGALLLGRQNARGVHFPFGKTASDFEREITHRCKGIDPQLVEFVKAYKAHLRGDDFLYAFGAISGPNKHQRLMRISLGNTKATIGRRGFLIMDGPIKVSVDKWNDLRHELEIMRVPPGTQEQIEIGVDYIPTIEVVVGTGVPPLSGNAAAAFNKFADVVEGIVLGIEAEAKKILASRD